MRTRSFIQDMLWGKTCFDQGRQSFRRALSDLRRITGEDFPKLFSVVGQEMTLAIGRVAFGGSPRDGLFLEGLDVREKAFVEWRDRIREEPHALWRFAAPAASATGCPQGSGLAAG